MSINDTMQMIDLTGQKYGKLTVIEKVPNAKQLKWRCMCECGKEVIVYGCNLRSGATNSCGCSTRTHGESQTKLYRIHQQIKLKEVCEDWKSYECFRDWAKENGYTEDNCYIQRHDSNKEYSPENCYISEGR